MVTLSPPPSVIRRPSVAGYFYPADPQELAEQVDALSSCAFHSDSGLWTTDDGLSPARALIAPHGSYRYAGAVLGATMGQARLPRHCVMFASSHTGVWMSWSLLLSGAYQTPLGEVPIDERLASALQARCPFLTTDPFAQRGEHAVEVLLPFLQRRGPADLSIVPIIANAGDPSEFAHLANVLADIIRRENEPVLLIASSDLSHAEPQDRVAASDRLLMDAIQSLDGARLLRIVHERSVRMCGAAVVACILEATRALGATQARLVRYSTSAEAGGDPASATGYAGFVIS